MYVINRLSYSRLGNVSFIASHMIMIINIYLTHSPIPMQNTNPAPPLPRPGQERKLKISGPRTRKVSLVRNLAQGSLTTVCLFEDNIPSALFRH